VSPVLATRTMRLSATDSNEFGVFDVKSCQMGAISNAQTVDQGAKRPPKWQWAAQ
jgi:hypothetical protein